VKSDKLEGIRAMLVVPTYGNPDPICQRDVRLGIMVAANNGVEWVGDASPDRMIFSFARNQAAQSLMNGGGKELADGIMWIDSDIRSKPSDIANLLLSVRDYKADFVTGVYHQRNDPMAPVIYEHDTRDGKFRTISSYPLDVFMPMGGCGFGFCWTSTELISAIANLKSFDKKRGWFPDDRDSDGNGEDLNFCDQAIKAGFQLYANTSIRVGHSGDPRVITLEDYIEAQAKKGAKDVEPVGK
jgi:hypothetical protein